MGYKAYFDGSCVLHYCGIGYVIRDADGRPVFQAGEYAGRGDPLKAEYLALEALVLRLDELGIDEAVIHGDSRTVVGQVNGQLNTRERNRFRDSIMQIRRAFIEHPDWRLKWIPRGENGAADSLATEGLSRVRSGK
ncbi:MAG: reverse transcriptase-like protein [Thermodesulfobacteriota bacterium]